MGTSLGPTLTNAFLCVHEQIWLNECPDEFKYVYYKRYVDDILVLFRSPAYLLKFKDYLNSKHRNFRLICENSHNNSMPFLDSLITRTNSGFQTSRYHRSTFSRIYSFFNS